ncbi:hypothetical protein ABZ464_24000 [Streptomyces sp. NPDC005820]|uniref:hypothetical protein n=1 Tax=Streptomyces sp. NPDC005820 TaxID=3157069 RepID=UPI0033CBB4E5
MDETTTTTRYYQFDDGRLREVTLSDGVSVSVPDGSVRLSAEEYTAALGVIEQERAAAEAAVQEEQEAEARSAYLALVAILPEAVARRLSGYQGTGVDRVQVLES